MFRRDKYDEKAAHAANTLRWIENSGPLYIEMDLSFIFIDLAENVVALLCEGDEVKWPARALSYASWYMCCSAKPGDDLILKIRCDESFYDRVETP